MLDAPGAELSHIGVVTADLEFAPFVKRVMILSACAANMSSI